MNDNNTPHKFYERLAALEIEVRNLKTDFETFCNNHFTTFKSEIRNDIKCLTKKYNKRPTWLVSGIMTGLISVCVGLIVYILTKGGI